MSTNIPPLPNYKLPRPDNFNLHGSTISSEEDLPQGNTKYMRGEKEGNLPYFCVLMLSQLSLAAVFSASTL